MIDLHAHLLPGIDDGAPDLETSLNMARIAVDDGIRIMACTPHVYPGMFDNEGPDIRRRVEALQGELDEAGIPLKLSWGADVHMAPDLLGKLKTGSAPTLDDSRYFLLEPPHYHAPPRFAEQVFELQVEGYVPVITHPERLVWIDTHYEVFREMTRKGVLMQITAGSLAGRFGMRARYWAERMLDEGLVHVLATDAHDSKHRQPFLAEGEMAAAKWVGKEEAINLVELRPLCILKNYPLEQLPAILVAASGDKRRRKGFLGRLLRW